LKKIDWKEKKIRETPFEVTGVNEHGQKVISEKAGARYSKRKGKNYFRHGGA